MNQVIEPVNPSFYFKAYCLAYFGFGLLTGSMGPLIPFLAVQRNKQQHQYSSLFMARTIGAVLAFASVWLLDRYRYKPCEHKQLGLWIFASFIGMFLFMYWSTTFGQIISFAIFGGTHYIGLRNCNLCLLEIGGDKLGTWMPLINAFFGTGALIAPLIIRFIDINIFYILAIIYFAFFIFCFSWPSPVVKNVVNQEGLDQPLSPLKQKQQNHASQRLEILVALAVFIIIGYELTACGWMSSYAVITKAMSEKDAAICGTLYWTMSTVCRFIISASSIRCSLKYKVLITSMVILSLILLPLDLMGASYLIATVGTLALGACCSAVFPLMMSIPKQYKVKFDSLQVSKIMFMPLLSSFFLTGITGQLLRLNIGMLFICLIAMSVALWIISMMFFKGYEQEAFHEDKSGQNIEMKDYQS